MRKSAAFITALAAALCLLTSTTNLAARTGLPDRAQDSKAAAKSSQNPVATNFEQRVKEYVKLREGLETKLPKLSKDATPDQIETHKKTFQELVRGARASSKHGDIFTAEAAALIRQIIREEFKGRDMAELRKTVVFDSEIKGVPLRVNYPYPETQELMEMPPTLLLKLPQLPKQVKYRFVGRSMLLVDRENGLIIDYMTDALP